MPENTIPFSARPGTISSSKMASTSTERSSSRERISVELGGGAAAVGGGLAEAGGHLVLQAGDPDLEELVEVLAEDGQELGPLEQGLAAIGGQRQHPGVEVEPGQLTVDEALRRLPQLVDREVVDGPGHAQLDHRVGVVGGVIGSADMARAYRRCPGRPGAEVT